ncbi:MAG: flippase [Candidatus Brocadiaceae bacterium]
MSGKFVLKLRNKFKDKDLKEILLGSSLALIYRIVGMISGYILILVISRHYGSKGVGIYNLSTSVLAIYTLVGTLGLKTYCLRFVSQLCNEGKYYKVYQLYIKIFQITIPLSLILVFIFFIPADKLSLYVFKDETLAHAFKVLSLVLPFTVVYEVNVEFIRGLKDVKYSEFLRNVTVPVFNTIFLVLIALFVVNYYISIYSYVIAIVISFLLSTFYIVKKIYGFKKCPGEKTSSSEILKVSLPMIMTSFARLIMGKITTIMLGIYSTTEQVGIFSVSLKLASITSFVLMAINTISAPKFSELFWSNKIEDLKKVVKFSSKLIFIISVPILCIFIMLPELSMKFFGKEFSTGKYALIFLVIGQFVNACAGSVGIFLNMTGNQNYFRNIMFISAALNIILNYLLIPRYGLNGAAIATMVSMSLWNIAGAVHIKLKHNISTFYIPLPYKLKKR